MNIKQTIQFMTVFAAVLLPFMAGQTAHAAINRDQFVNIVCENYSSAPASETACVKDARDGTLTKRWHGFVIKQSDWRNKTPKQLRDEIKDKSESEDRNENGDDADGGGTWGGGDGCGGANTAIIKCDASNSGDVEDNGIWAILLMVINIMTAGVGVLAVAGIVYGSVLYTTAGDKSDQVKQATDIITNVVIGLVAFALMWAGLNFIIPGGVFS